MHRGSKYRYIGQFLTWAAVLAVELVADLGVSAYAQRILSVASLPSAPSFGRLSSPSSGTVVSAGAADAVPAGQPVGAAKPHCRYAIASELASQSNPQATTYSRATAESPAD
jgi:hypothetical protein